MRVQTISIEGTSALSTSTLEAFVRNELSGNYWAAFPKDNILLYPKETVEKDILAAFPSIRSAALRADTLTSITLSVAERTPSALWCGEAAETASSTPSAPVSAAPHCLILDEDGVAYAAASSSSGTAYLPYYGALPGGGTTLPAQFLPPGSFKDLSALVAALAGEANAGAPSRVVVDENNDVHLQFGNGFVLLFALGGDAGKLAQRFALALASSPFAAHPLSSFQYLDMRFGDKLYFKLK